MAAAYQPESGLKVVRHIAGIASTLYGTHDRCKCVSDGDVSLHLSCAAHILQNLDIQHPVGRMVNDLVQNHHQTYGCGTKTLLMTLDLLAAAASSLRDKGLDETTITKGLKEAVELIISHLPTVHQTVLFDQREEKGPVPENSCKTGEDKTETKSSEIKSQAINDEDWIEVCLDNPQPKTCSTNSTEIMETPLVTPSSENSRDEIPNDISSGVPYVQLSMKPIQTNADTSCPEEDVDDIGWYFEDGKVPEEEPIEAPVKDLLKKVADIFDDFSNIGIKESIPKSASNAKSTAPQISPLTFSSLQDNGDFDDFERCFDGGNSKNDSLDSFSPMERGLNGKELDKGEKASTDEFDDEFDSCFDDVKFNVKDTKVKLQKETPTKNPILQNILSGTEKKNNALKELLNTDSEKDQDESFNFEDHFSDKTETPVVEREPQAFIGNAGGIKGISLGNECRPTTADNLTALIEAIMKTRKSVNKGLVLNRSRHYRDIESSVTELSTSFISFTEAENSDICIQDSLPSNKPLEGFNFDDKNLHACREVANDISVGSHQGESPPESLIEAMRSSIGGYPESSDKESNQEVDDAKDDFEKKLKKILESKPKLSMSLLNRGSRHYRTINDCDVKTEEVSGKDSPQEIKVGAQAGETCISGESTANPDSSDIGTKQDSTESHIQVPDGILENKIRVVTEDKLGSLILSLSHGDVEVAQILKTAVWQQQRQNSQDRLSIPLQELRFDPQRVQSLTLPGVSSHRSGVVDGLVVPASGGDMELLQTPRPRRVLLINGDVSETFQHRGMNAKPETVLVTRGVSALSKEGRWLQNIIETLEELSVSALLVKGKVSTALREHCEAHDIVVLSHVDPRVLMAVAETTQAEMAQYVAECTQDNVAQDVLISVWSPDWSDQVTCLRHNAYALVTTKENIVQTALFCHPCGDVALMVEERFWHAAYRLRNTLDAGKLVVGGSDYYLAERLHREAEMRRKSTNSGSNTDLHGLLPVILETVAEGFRTLAQTAHFNNTGDRSLPNTTPLSTATESRRDLSQPLLICDEHSEYIPETQPEFHNDICDTPPNQISQNPSYVIPTCDTSMASCISYGLPLSGSHRLTQGLDSCIGDGSRLFDDYTSKVEAYRSAVHLVGQVLNTDFEVVTGLTGAKLPKHPNMVGML